MKKLSFRFLSVLIAALMLLSTASEPVFAEGTVTDPLTAAEKACYTGKVVDWSFDNLTETSLTGASGDTATDSLGNVWYIKEGKTAEIVSDSEHGKVLQWHPATIDSVGVSKNNYTNYLSAKGLSELKKFKIEFEAKLLNQGKTLYFKSNNSEWMQWNADANFKFANVEGQRKHIINEVYAHNEWLKITLYYDFEAQTPQYHVYLEDTYLTTTTARAYTTTVGDLRFSSNDSETYPSTLQLDNIKLYAYEAPVPLTLESTSLTDGQTNVEPTLSSYTATFNKDLGTVTDAMVTVESTDGGTVPTYSVSNEGKELTVAFTGGFTSGKTYKVTFLGTIPTSDGLETLTTAVSKTFKIKPETPSGGGTGGDGGGGNTGGDNTGDATNDPLTAAEKARYTGKIADFTFEDISAESFTGMSGDTVTYKGNVYHVSEGKTLTITSDSEHGKVAQWSEESSYKVGVAKANIDNYLTANSMSSLKKAKVEFEVKGLNQQNFYMYNGTSEWIRWWPGGKFKFANANGGPTNASAVVTEESYPDNEWVKVTLYFDFDAGNYHIYINDVYQTTTTVRAYTSSITDIRFATYHSTAYPSTIQLDDIKVYAYEAPVPLTLESTSLTDGQTNVEPTLSSYTATFNKDLGTVTDAMVTIESTDGGTVPTYSVSKEGKELTVAFTGGFTSGKTYKVTFLGTIPTSDGLETLTTAVSKTFTIKSEGASGGGTGGDDNTGGDDTGSDTTPGALKEIEANKIANFDFDDLTGDLTGGVDNTVTDSLGNIYYVSNGKTATVVSESGRGNVVQISTSSANDPKVGVPKSVFDAYSEANGAPSRIKLEFDLKQITDWKYAYMYVNGSNEMIIWGGNDGKIQFSSSAYKARDVAFTSDDYKVNKWTKVTMYFDFNEQVYHIYLNDVYKTTTAIPSTMTSLTDFTLTGNASHQLQLDNIKVYEYDIFKFTGTVPSENATNVSVTDDIEFKFSDELGSVDKTKVKILKGEAETEMSLDKYNVLLAGNTLKVSFTEALELNTKYKVIVKGDAVKDKYGWALDGSKGTYTGIPGQTAEDMSVTFTTTNEGKLYIGNPVFNAGKVTAKLANYTAEAKSATLMVAEFKKDGSVTMHAGANGSVTNLTNDVKTLEVDFVSGTDTQKAVAFIIDGNEQELFSDALVYSDNTSEKSEDMSSVTLDNAQLSGDILTVSGKLGKRNVAIKITKDGSLVMVVPVQKKADGKFSQDIDIKLSSFAFGKYDISLIGFNIPESNSKNVRYLTGDEKDQIKDAINDAITPEAVEAVLKSVSIQDMMLLDDKYRNDCTYSTLRDQRPFASYDDIVTMIYKAYTLKEKVDSTDWLGYTDLLLNNSNILLKTATKFSTYSTYGLEAKQAINTAILDNESYPFVDFRALSAAFDKAVSEYVPTGGGGGGGGAGGGAGGGGGGGTPPSDKMPTPTIVSPGNAVVGGSSSTTQLFTDIYKASWASKSVNRLHSMGIISADKEFRPLDNVTREEFVKMLVQLVGITVDGKKSTFTDAKPNEWYAPYLGAAQNAGIIKGNDDGTFGVGKNISRQDMVVMAQRAIAIMNKTVKTVKEEQNFLDSNNISDYAQEAVAEMQKAGVISGMGDGNFAPLETANRAQAAVVVSNLIDAIE